jgi:hypothetical protein
LNFNDLEFVVSTILMAEVQLYLIMMAFKLF